MVFSKKPPVLLTAGATLLLLGGGAIAYWGLSQRRPEGRHLPVGARAIPADALMAFSLSTESEQWRRLRQFGTAETQGQFDQLLVQWRDRWLTRNGLSFSQDIQPWVGPEVTIAVMPELDSTAAPLQPEALPLPEDASNLLVAVPIADPLKAQNQLAKLEQASAPAQDYKGVAIETLTSSEGEPLYGALLSPELVVLSNQLATLEQAVDAFKSDQSLVTLPGLSRAFEQLEAGEPFSRFYLNVPAAVQSFANSAQPALPPARLEGLKAGRGLAGTLALEAKGLKLEGISWLAADGAQTFSSGNGAGQLPQKLPGDALLMVSGGDFRQFWQDLTARQSLTALLPIEPENIAVGLQAATGLSLEEDLLPWSQGEFALGVLNPPTSNAPAGSKAPLPNPALVLMLKASDRQAAEATLTELNQVMESRYRFGVSSAELGGVPITRWTSPFDSLTMSYGWLEGDTVFLSLGETIDAAVAPKPKQPLAQASLFQLTTGAAPRPNNGHFFLNLKALMAAQNSLLLPPLPAGGLVSSQAIEAIGVTATSLSDRQVRYDLFIALSRGNRPGSLPSAEPEATPEAAPEAKPTPSPAPTP